MPSAMLPREKPRRKRHVVAPRLLKSARSNTSRSHPARARFTRTEPALLSGKRRAQDVPAGGDGVDVLVGAERGGARDHPVHPVGQVGVGGGAEERA